MVNNTTNINKTNNHLWSYLIKQTNKQTNKTTTYDVGNQCPALGQAHNCGGIKPVKHAFDHVLINYI